MFDGFSLIFSFFAQSELLPLLLAQLLLFKERREQFTLVTNDKRATVKKSLPLLFLEKSDHEQFANEAHGKRGTGAIFSFSQANRSFGHKK